MLYNFSALEKSAITVRKVCIWGEGLGKDVSWLICPTDWKRLRVLGESFNCLERP